MYQRYRRGLWALFSLAVLAALTVPAASAQEDTGDDRTGYSAPTTYHVTIENLTGGQPFTPPVIASHSPAANVFRTGQPASAAIQDLAENGGVPTLVGALEGAGRSVGEVVVAESVAQPPLLPGEAVTVELGALRRHRRLSFASMLICTNDGFTGVDSLRLPNRAGTSTIAYVNAYDAGTERNTEDFDDLVPPCGPLTGVDSGGAGTGMTNPALAENGVIHAHTGVTGSADLVPAVHDWDDPVAKITVTRVDRAPRYEVSIVNETTGQPFTPPVVAVHNRRVSLYQPNQPASAPLQGLAENGDVGGLVGAIETARHVFAVDVGSGPVLPGSDQTVEVIAPRNIRRLSFASMLICTNDGFAGANSLRLPHGVGDSVSAPLRGYDAGTERNTEDFDDLVPPCGPLTGVDSGGAGTGMTNPALAQNSVIRPHGGVKGSADLIPAVHDWTGPVGEIVITRVR
ncbi:MAG: spondin domain-containing protein [Acidimicrobiales bacterium]